MSDVTTSTYTAKSTGVQPYMDTVYEDVEGIIQMISPSKTPFIASIGNVKAKSTYHEWLEDELKAPTGTNKAIEGADATATTRVPPARLGNYTQIIEDTYKLSQTSIAVDNIGRKAERYEADKSMKYINTEIEYAALNNAAYASGNAGTARAMKGLEGFVSTNDKSYGSYASTNDFSEAKLMEMAQASFTAGGEPDILLVGPAQSRKISNWNQTGRITVNTNATEKTLTMAVMVLETPFGRLKIVLDRYIAQDTSTSLYDRVYLYDSQRLAMATLRPFKADPLAKVGDSQKYQGVWEGTLVCWNEKSAAKCKRCATD